MRTLGVMLLVLTLPVLMTPAPDETTFMGHIETCPFCRWPDNNPSECRAARELTFVVYLKDGTAVRPGARRAAR